MRSLYDIPQYLKDSGRRIRDLSRQKLPFDKRQIGSWLQKQHTWVIWGVVAIFLFLAMTDGLLFKKNVDTLTDRQQLVAHSQEIHASLADLLLQLVNAETGQRGYTLTGDPTYLQPYHDGVKATYQDIIQLQQIVAPHGYQDQALSALIPLVNAKLIELQLSTQAIEGGNSATALRIIDTNIGQYYMERIRAQALAAEQHAVQTLEQRHAMVQQSITNVIVTFVIGLIALCLFFGLSGILIQLYLQSRERLVIERQTQVQQEQGMRQLAEEALEQRDQLFGIVAHELKNPITALLTTAQVLQRQVAKEALRNDRIPRMLETQIYQTRRLKTLIDEMLDTARITNGVFTVERGPLDLVPLVHGIIQELQTTTTEHTLIFKEPEQEVWVEGDRIRLEQVCYNLLLNAIKYSPEGGEIHIDLQSADHEAVLRVRDDGIGIPTEALPHLFEQLYRAPNANQHQVKGMGVGLYITQQIVQLHDGKIAVESEEGKGSTFSIMFPQVANAVEVAAQPYKKPTREA